MVVLTVTRNQVERNPITAGQRNSNESLCGGAKECRCHFGTLLHHTFTVQRNYFFNLFIFLYLVRPNGFVHYIAAPSSSRRAAEPYPGTAKFGEHSGMLVYMLLSPTNFFSTNSQSHLASRSAARNTERHFPIRLFGIIGLFSKAYELSESLSFVAADCGVPRPCR